MTNFISSASEPDSSLQAPVGRGSKAEEQPRMETEGKKRLLELQTLYDRSLEEIQSLGACNLVLEGKHRENMVLLEDKEEQINRLKGQIIKHKEGAKSMSGTEARLNEDYDRLKVKYRKRVEAFESEGRKWKEEEKKIKEKCLLLEVEKGKIEIDLQVARNGENGSRDVVEKMKRLLEEKDLEISELVRKHEMVVKEKRKVEEELNGRVINLEKLVAKWLNGNAGKSVSPVVGKVFNVNGKGVKNLQNSGVCSDVGVACSVKGKGIGDLQNSGPKSVGTPLIQPKEEIIEADVQVKGNDRKKLCSMVSGIKKEVTYSPKSTDSVVQISDDEDEVEKEKEKEHILPVPTSSTPTWLRKRKYDALTCSAEKEKQAVTTFCKSNSPQEGKLWETPDKLFIALTDSSLCLKSICALYRKNNSLGAWKNQCNQIKKPLSKRGMDLGKRFTGGDTEGRMNKEACELNRIDEDTMMECRNIVRSHYKELFEIYNNDMDPLFQP